MSAQTQSTNIAIFTRACWLAGFSFGTVVRSCRRAGASQDQITTAMKIYDAEESAMARTVIVDCGAHLDRRQT
ncbi:hypothetical protein [Mesorhizobium sp. B2-1-2]|uniref:hypothetical protein n=1 Tax=Mesorhizobium sp. B2-1-2 TaxID=2589973 RepID=UPI00112B69BA|nr:hypothetical protein [Mesorhizobium sp. B2-1-2]TPN11683.1 hypothetical protein FJ971_09755 [Mesorhizobium sp. B2-1-2]